VAPVDPDKNPIKKILEDSQTSAFPEADRDVFEAIASYHEVPYLAGSKPEVWNGQEKTADWLNDVANDAGTWIKDNVGRPLNNAVYGEPLVPTGSNVTPKEMNDYIYDTTGKKVPEGTKYDAKGNIVSPNEINVVNNPNSNEPTHGLDSKVDQSGPDLYNMKGYLQEGSKGDVVKQVQQQLGFKGDSVDGVYGPQTAAAVEAYQNKFNESHANDKGFTPISADGVIGAQTAKALYDPGVTPPTAGPLPLTEGAPVAPTTPVIPKGSNVEDMHKEAYGFGDFASDTLKGYTDPMTGFGLTNIGDRARFLQDQIGLPQGESFLGGPSFNQLFGEDKSPDLPNGASPSSPEAIKATEDAINKSLGTDTKPYSEEDWPMLPTKEQLPADQQSELGKYEDQTNQTNKPANQFAGFKPGEPLYSIGDTGNQVKQIQKLIGADQDGVFGQQTQQALMDWQQKNNLQVDGDFGAQSLAAAQGNANAANVAPGVMKVSHFVTAAGEEPTPEELDAIRREEEAADPGIGGFKVGPGTTGVTPAEGSGVNPNLKKWQTPQAVQSEGQGVRPREFQGEGELTGGGASPEYAQTGGNNPYTFQGVVSPQNNGTDSFTVKMTAGPVDVKIDRSGSIVAIDGVDAASADQLNPVQLAAVAILQNQAAKAKFPLALGQFGNAISQAMGNPEFSQQVSDSIGIGPTASRTVSETGDRNVGNQDSGIDKDFDFNSFVERQIATDYQEGKMPVGSLAELRQVLQEAGPAAIRAAASNDEEFASFPPEQQEQLRPIRNMLTLYNTYKDIFNKNMPAETTESSPSLGDISVAAKVGADVTPDPKVINGTIPANGISPDQSGPYHLYTQNELFGHPSHEGFVPGMPGMMNSRDRQPYNDQGLSNGVLMSQPMGYNQYNAPTATGPLQQVVPPDLLHQWQDNATSVHASLKQSDLSSQPVVNPVPLSEEQGYPVETIEEQLEGAPSAVGHGEPKEAAQGKQDHPSPKAAEAVFKALEENNHEAAHELMGHTDCPMDCETENEGVCRHGYMSAGRTRVVFLDTDLRRGGSVHQSESLKDIYDTFSNPLTAFTGEQIAANPALTHLLPNPEGRANYSGPSIDEFKAPGIFPGTETTQATSSTREAFGLEDVWNGVKDAVKYNPITNPTIVPELALNGIDAAGTALGKDVFYPAYKALTTPESAENLGEWSDATKQFQKNLQDQYDANQKAPMPSAPEGKLTVPGYDANGNPLPQN